MQNITDLKPLELAKIACETMMNKFEAEKLPPEQHFHYHQGVFLSGVEQTYLHTGDRRYADYIKAWVDSLITEDGGVCGYDLKTLDDKQPAILLFRILEETGDERYEKAIKYIKSGIDNWPVCKEGGFWHKILESRSNQMWLDGLYMAGELLSRYGAKFGEEKCFDIVHMQAKLMWENIRDEKTGLLYHAWDSSHKAPWCDKETGRAPHFWGRAAGWYIVALTTALKYMPKDYENRDELIGYVRDYIEAFTKYQDEKTGLWYQVIDKADCEDNWTETSCTALFLCGISMAIDAGYVDAKYKENADRAYKGLLDAIEDDGKGGIILPRICVGTGVGDYQYYIERPIGENDLHGMGALLLGCNAYHDICNK